MTSPVNFESGTPRVWCLGVPLVAERKLTGEEISGLEVRCRELRRLAALWFAASPLVFLAIVLVLIGAGGLSAGRSAAAGLATFIALALALSAPWLTIGRGYNALTEARAMAREMRDGIILIFSGPIPDRDVFLEMLEEEASEEDAARTTVEIFGVPVELDKPVTIEIFASSGQLLKLNQQTVSESVFLQRFTTAPVPIESKQAGQWAETATIDTDGAYDLGHYNTRTLTEAEKAELKELWRGNLRNSTIWTLWLGGLLGLPLSILVTTSSTPILTDWFFWALTVPFLAGGYYCAYYWWHVCLQWRDYVAGYVIVTKLPQDEKLLIPKAGADMELLAYSNAEWTRDQRPARWRTG